MLCSILLNVSFVYFTVVIIKGFHNDKVLPLCMVYVTMVILALAIWEFKRCAVCLTIKMGSHFCAMERQKSSAK